MRFSISLASISVPLSICLIMSGFRRRRRIFASFKAKNARTAMIRREGSVVITQATVCVIISCQNVGDNHVSMCNEILSYRSKGFSSASFSVICSAPTRSAKLSSILFNTLSGNRCKTSAMDPWAGLGAAARSLVPFSVR